MPSLLTNAKLSKSQLANIIQSEDFLVLNVNWLKLLNWDDFLAQH